MRSSRVYSRARATEASLNLRVGQQEIGLERRCPGEHGLYRQSAGARTAAEPAVSIRKPWRRSPCYCQSIVVSLHVSKEFRGTLWQPLR